MASIINQIQTTYPATTGKNITSVEREDYGSVVRVTTVFNDQQYTYLYDKKNNTNKIIDASTVPATIKSIEYKEYVEPHSGSKVTSTNDITTLTTKNPQVTKVIQILTTKNPTIT